LDERFPQICPVQCDSVLGKATISTGRIRGGTKINVVPDRCYAEVDIRILPSQESMAAAIADLFQKQRIPAIVRPIKISAPLYTSPDHPFIEKLVALGLRLTGASWFCDAAFFALQGTPAHHVDMIMIKRRKSGDTLPPETSWRIVR
jgi:acetylornithine deacetylase/succinyl-diaminopimelate desuccinylase-like protein